MKWMQSLVLGFVVAGCAATTPAPEKKVEKKALAPSTPEGIALFQRMTFGEIKRRLILPEHLKKRSLAAAVFLKMDENGRVTDLEVRRSSGNAEFDQLALDAIRKSEPLPTPPLEAVHDGMLVDFLPY